MNILLRLAALSCLLAAASFVRAEPVEVIRNVTYYEGPDQDARQRLDIYLPKGAGKFPTVVFFHGGSWVLGSKDRFLGLPGHRPIDHGKFFAEHGIAAVFANYRLSPKVKHPEHVTDAARAFAWVRQHIPDYGGDPDRLFVMGHSAGGHLASLVTSDPEYLMAQGMTPSMARGVISVSGVFILAGEFESSGSDRPIKGPGMFFAHVFGSDPTVQRKASPIAHVRTGMPPFLIAYADNDMVTLPAQAEAFANALAAKQNDVHKLLVPDRGHQSILKNSIQADDPLGNAILEFIRTGKP